MPGKTLNLSEVSDFVGIKRRTLYNQIDDGRFPVRPIPGTKPRLWNVADLEDWLAGQYRQARG